ncbi:hypothetical protein D3C73_1098120 [compost metagenome]
MIGPDSGEIIALQLEADLIFVVFGLAQALAERIQLLRSAQQSLHMMPDFMGDHVSHGEIAGRLEALLQLIVEAEVNIQLAVARAVERPDGRSGCPAGRIHAPAI